MRVLKLAVFYVFLAFIVVVPGFLIAQRIVLYVGKQQLISAVSQLKGQAHQQLYFNRCRDVNRQYGQDNAETYFWIRFENDQDFILESVCGSLPDKPQEIARGSLNQFVSKVPGTSGIIFNDQTYKVELTAFAQVSDWVKTNIPPLLPLVNPTAAVVVQDEKVVVTQESAVYPPGPVTACVGYGYTCCDGITLDGVGTSITATDCKNRCFASCSTKPSIVSFTASPNFDQFKRQAEVGPKEDVEFWLVSGLNQDTYKLQLDFGDGSVFNGSLQQLPVTHSYICTQPQCQFDAQAVLVSPSGAQSAVTDISKITIVVQQ